MKPAVYEIIELTAKHHRIPFHPDLVAACEWEVERCEESNAEELIEALKRGFRVYERGLA